MCAVASLSVLVSIVQHLVLSQSDFLHLVLLLRLCAVDDLSWEVTGPWLIDLLMDYRLFASPIIGVFDISGHGAFVLPGAAAGALDHIELLPLLPGVLVQDDLRFGDHDVAGGVG